MKAIRVMPCGLFHFWGHTASRLSMLSVHHLPWIDRQSRRTPRTEACFRTTPRPRPSSRRNRRDLSWRCSLLRSQRGYISWPRRDWSDCRCDKSSTSRFRISAPVSSRGIRWCRTGSMGIWHSRQATSLRGNRFYWRPERSHCFRLSLFRRASLKQQCVTDEVECANGVGA